MAEPFGSMGTSSLQEISAAQVNHLPIVAYFARRLGLVQIVNSLVPTQMEVEPGLIALGLVLDTLSGRSPLYHLQTAFDECDRALLFGQELPAESFNDDNVGRMLDHFYEGQARSGSSRSCRWRPWNASRYPRTTPTSTLPVGESLW